MCRVKTKIAAIFVSFVFVATATAGSIGINFKRAAYSDGLISPDGIAGLVGDKAWNWNNIISPDNMLADIELVDDSGDLCGTILRYEAGGQWGCAVSGSSADQMLGRSYIAGPAIGSRYDDGVEVPIDTDITISNVPFVNYKVILYLSEDGNTSFTWGDFWVNDIKQNSGAYCYPFQDYYDNNPDLDGWVVGQNALVWENVTGSEIQIQSQDRSNNLSGCIAGIQIVSVDPMAAKAVSPRSGSTGVSVNPTFEWLKPEGFEPVKYELCYGLDPNVDTPIGVLTVDSDTTVQLSSDLDNETEYYWRVTSFESESSSYISESWKFTTELAIPIMTKQSDYVFAELGEEASFTVEASNAASYQWYIDPNSSVSGDEEMLVDNDIYAGAASNTLQIKSISELHAKSEIYCVASNIAGTAVSDNIGLRIKTLLGYWPLNGSAAEANDSSLSGVIAGSDGSAGNPVWVDGVQGEALELDGSTYVEVFNFDMLKLRDAFSVACWVKDSSSNSWETFVSWMGESNQGWQLRRYSGENRLLLTLRGTEGDDDAAGYGSWSDGSWHYVVGVYDMYSNVRSVYIDGKLNSQISDGGLVAEVSEEFDKFLIGKTAASWGNYYRGAIDEVKYYNYPLSSLDVAAEYSSINGEFCLEQPGVDLNGDCTVDVKDLAILAGQWLDCGFYPSCY